MLLKTEVRTKIFPSGKGKTRTEKGVCTLSKEAFCYASESVRFTIPTKNLPAIAFSCNAEFELYYEQELYYFYPAENRRQCVRWGLFADLIREEMFAVHDEPKQQSAV